MYARQLSIKSSAGNRAEVEALADQVFSFMKTLNGFVAAHFLVSTDETEYGAFSLWETREDAETGGATLRAKTKETLGKLATEPPVETIFEVYKPN